MRTLFAKPYLKIGLCAAAVLLSGCALVQQAVKPPQLELESVQLVNASLMQQTLRLGFKVTNPNGFSLPVTALHYTVALEGQDVADGSNAQGFTLSANGSTTFSTDVSTSVLNILQLIGNLNPNGAALHYNVKGAFTIHKFFDKDVPFTKTGEIKLTQ